MNTAAAAESLFGRERELARIHRFFQRAATAPATLVLEGEPGIGKTTLWRAGVEAAQEQGRLVLQARPAEAERDLSFSGLGDLLEPALERLDALPAPRRRALRVALLLDAGKDAPDPRAVGLATLDLLRLLVEDGPLVLAVDDTQWLDPPSREVLAYALRRLDSEPVAFLAARRPGADSDALGSRERVVVGPLSVGALQEVIRARVGSAVSRPTLIRVHETSGGNPYFALELVRALEGRDLRPGEPLPVPESLADLTAARFGPLGPEAQEVLLYVAALGRPTFDVVISAAGEHAAPALQSAADSGVIEAEGSRLRFTHPLLASVRYAAATHEERARVHRRLATVVTDPEERGRHLGAAATAPDADVAAALDEAAAAARARGAPATAAELAELAVRLTPSDDPAALLRRLCTAADHHFTVGATVRARSLLEQALSEAPRGRVRARVALQLAALLDAQDGTALLPLLARALHEAEGDPAVRAELHCRLASFYLDEIDVARRHAHLASRLATRTGDARLIVETLSLAFDRDFWAGAGIDHASIRRGISLEDEVPGLALSSRPSCVYAFALKWAGDLERASPLWDRLQSLGRSSGDLTLIQVLFYSSYHELIAENWERAALLAEEAMALSAETERDVEFAGSLWARATVSAYRGEATRAHAEAVEAHRLATAVGYPDLLLSGLALGVLELSLGEPEAALACLRPSTEVKLAQGVREPGLICGFPEHVEAAVACGELDEARRLLEFVEEHARRLDRAWALGCAARGRALLAAERGDDAAAEAAFAAAYEQHARRPNHLRTYELARTLLLHGSMLRRRQQKRRARAALEQARPIFERLGAQAYAERARSELARIGGRAAAAGDELSETERQIADLVAQGRSNKEVAAALSVSPKTVEWNLSKVYAKLGVRSRAELASRRR